MSRAVIDQPRTGVPGLVDDWPEGAFYHSPRGLYPFQEDGIGRAYLNTEHGGGELIVWDTGTGKTHMGLGMAALLAQDAMDGVRDHDITIVVCEQNKLKEWVDDFGKFTLLQARAHHGTGRMQRLEKLGLPQVLVTTYETGKLDMARSVLTPGAKRKVTHIETGPLYDLVADMSVLWIFDEIGKLRNRTAANYKAYDWILARQRHKRYEKIRVIGMTATPIERDWEDAFNMGRLIRPDLMPLVKDFEKRYVRWRDPYGRAKYHEGMMPEFAALFRPFLQRKRKTDPDIIDQFPKRVEESQHLQMGPEQTWLYELVESLGYDGDEPPPGLWTALRQVAGHPAALVESARVGESTLTKMIVEELGADRILAIPSVKEKWLIDYLGPLVKGQGAKVVVFTFFGPSMIPTLRKALQRKKFKVYTYYTDMTQAQREEQKAKFRADSEPCVLLTSDAGARGINLPEATYVVEYESALTYANRTQRLNRIHRIDSDALSVSCMTAIVDHTVEVAIVNNMLERNDQQDVLLDDLDAGENFMTADDRRRAMRVASLSKPTRKRK